MLDLTAIFESEEARMVAERKLAAQCMHGMAADRLPTLGEMAVVIAHELKQPLTGVRCLAEHLLLAMDRGWCIPQAEQREKLLMIVAQADRMADIIERVWMSGREAGTLDVHAVRLNDVIQS